MKYLIIIILLLFNNIIHSQGLLTKSGIYFANKSFKINYYSKNDKELVTIPILHVNKPEFYKMTKRKIDSLRNEGYVIFYESIETNIKDSLRLDALQRKFRSVTGFALMDYLDEENETFKSLQKEKFVSQTKVDYGVNEETDFRADLNLEDLIEKYELRYGIIELNKCDYSTPLGKKYKCSKIDKDQEYYMTNVMRDHHVIHEIEKSDAKKIVLVYGRIHIMNLYSKFQKKGWKSENEKGEYIKDF